MKKSKNGLPILNREETKQFIEKWKVDKTKPILLMGETGVGKTTLLKNEFKGIHRNGEEYTNFVSAHDIVNAYNQKGVNEFMNNFCTVKIPSIECVDDIGVEVLGNHYGSSMNVLEYLIQRWYENNKMPCFTTNQSAEGLIEFYGKRVYDRIKEKCYIIVVEDTDFRDVDKYAEVEKILS